MQLSPIAAAALTVSWIVIMSCSVTDYDLLQAKGGDDAAGVGGSATATGGADGTSTGGANTTPPDPDDCTSVRDATLTSVRLRASNGLCLAQGPSTILGSEPGYELALLPCTETLDQRWTIEAEAGGVWEIRNEAVDMNIDIKYADTADGTEFVMYEPHALYNQRFLPLPDASGGFRLSPRHVSGKCGEVRGDESQGYIIELWPCDTGNSAQVFDEIPCFDP